MAATLPVSPKLTRDLSIPYYFRKLQDPRRAHCRLHPLQNILVIALCAILTGAQDWQAIALFGQKRRAWLAGFLDLSNGIPSHDTFERVFDRLHPAAFQACFRAWVQALEEALLIKHVAIDGKTLRGSGSVQLKPLHLVSAWATEQRLSLGQVAVDEKSNEITAIPALLDLLDLHGALVTIDAMGCQKAIAQKIIDRKGDYLLTVKDNQPTLLTDIQQAFVQAAEQDFANLEQDTYETWDHGHGRQEYRCYTVLHDVSGIGQAAAWKNLTTIGICYSTRTTPSGTSEETRYFIGSRKASAQVYGQALREHWGIENSLHWHLDVSFAEDDNRVTKRHGAENLGLLRRLALSLLHAHPAKLAIDKKRYAAGLDTDFLEEILRGDGIAGKR